MKQLYLSILVLCISCAEAPKDKKEIVEHAPINTHKPEAEEQIVAVEVEKGNEVPYNTEDISGAYELIEGVTHFTDGESNDIMGSELIIERLSETDFGFYSADKIKERTPLGVYGVLKKIGNDFHKLGICSGEAIEGYTESDFTTGLYLYNKIQVYTKGDSLGIVEYGGNFRKYRLFKKKNNQSNMYRSLVKTMKDTKLEYQNFLNAYESAKAYDTSKLKVVDYFDGELWKTKHYHNESYASFEKTHFYQNPLQEGQFGKQDAVFESQFKNPKFKEVLATLWFRPLPLKENTGFDDFIEAEDYKYIDVETFKLHELYPDLKKEGSGYKQIRCYRTEISKEFYSVVVTILKNDQEMESVLINYDLDGNIIDSKVVSYEEIAEGLSRTESKIGKTTIKTNHIFWDLIKEIEQETSTVNNKGIINKINVKNLHNTLENYTLILSVLDELSLSSLDVKTDLIVSKDMPQDLDEFIVIIPEIVSEGAHYFELNSHIVLINNRTGKISNKYFEGSSSNHWHSDAVTLRKISIDSTFYMVTKDTSAFGVKVNYNGDSRANPFSNGTISLFVKSGDTLKKVLSNYDIMNYGGERITDCLGEFVSIKNTINMSNEKTNGYYDIIVHKEQTETKNEEDENGDCVSTDTVTTDTFLLKFNGETYKEHH